MDRREFISAAAAAMVLPSMPAQAQGCSGFGRFIGNLDLRALVDGRRMKLLAPYSYIDRTGLVWDVPGGVELDGATIPPMFWSVVGGPWDGPYRNASVIHDWYCMTRSRPWRAVHVMFYEAMLAACTSPARAGAMYAAVMIGGPKWAAPNPLNALLTARLGTLASEYQVMSADEPAPSSPPEMSPEAFSALVARIEAENLDRAQIEALLPQ